MKKFSSLLLIMLMLVTFTGCGSNNASQVTSEDISGTTVTIGVWKGNNGEEKALDELITGFEEKTGATVEKKEYTDISQQLTTELIGGTAPDVFYVDALLAQSLIEDEGLLQLNDYLTQEDIDDFYPSILTPFMSGDEIYALPKDYSTLGVYYNEDLLKEAGYTADDIPTDLESFPAFITELQSNLPEGKTAFLNTVDLSRMFTWLQTQDQSILTEDGKVDFENETIVENAQIILDLYNTEGSKEAIDIGYDWGGDAFGAGDAAMIIEGPWLLPTLDVDYPDTNFGVKPMPTYNGEQNTPAYTVGWGVNANAQNLSGGVQFALYATSQEGMSTWASNAKVLPTRVSVTESLGITDNEIANTFASQAENATVWQLDSITDKVFQEFNNVIPSILSGELSLEEGFAKIDNAVNQDLEDFNE